MNEMFIEKFSIQEIDHSEKYKVFDVYDPKNQISFRVFGMGAELPHKELKSMRVGQKRLIGKERHRYERII